MERSLSGPQIRAGRPDDLDALERIENGVFETDRLSRRSLRYFLRAVTTDVAIAEEAGRILGYAMISFRSGSCIGRVFSLAVDHDATRRGIGHALLHACEAAATARGATFVRLEVRIDNPGAIALYERDGYVQFDAISDYYEDSATALRFEKRLAATGADRAL